VSSFQVNDGFPDTSSRNSGTTFRRLPPDADTKAADRLVSTRSGRHRPGQAMARIAARIDRLAHGKPGDVKSIGSGISEMRIDYDPGYRVYLVQRGLAIVVILCGGDKRTQAADIKRAIKIAADWKE
jgi:putative addiction module killer protein